MKTTISPSFWRIYALIYALALVMLVILVGVVLEKSSRVVAVGALILLVGMTGVAGITKLLLSLTVDDKGMRNVWAPYPVPWNSITFVCWLGYFHVVSSRTIYPFALVPALWLLPSREELADVIQKYAPTDSPVVRLTKASSGDGEVVE